MKTTKILLKNARLIEPVAGIDTVTDILIVDGTIESIRRRIAAGRGSAVIEMAGKLAAPGFFDMHVHLREPGFEYKETVETGCAAAAAGGFTGLACMPNTSPVIDDAAVVRYVRERSGAVCRGVVDVHPVAAVTRGREGKELAPMIELAAAGACAFSDDGAPVADAGVMRRALEYAAMVGRPVIQHAEELSLTRGGVMNEGLTATVLGLPGMPPVGEETMVARDVQLVRYTRGQYHLAHVSTAGAVDLIRSARAEGLEVSCEVTPHHFSLTDEEVRSFDTNTKMNPPLRTADDVEAIKAALADGTIGAIASDHAPHSPDDKDVEYRAAPFGIVGLETAVGLAMTVLVEPNILSLSQLVEKFSINPRRILHLPPVTVAEGSPANLTLLDPEAEWVVDVHRFKSKSRNSPFGGKALKGRAIGIINHGVFWEG